MSRSVKKGPYVHPKLARKVERAQNTEGKVVIKTWSRASTLRPNMLGMPIAVHARRRPIPVFITDNSAGHQPGQRRRPPPPRGAPPGSERSSAVRR